MPAARIRAVSAIRVDRVDRIGLIVNTGQARQTIQAMDTVRIRSALIRSALIRVEGAVSLELAGRELCLLEQELC